MLGPQKPHPVRVYRSGYSPSGEAFWSPALSISAPIFLETFGACPLVCGAGTLGVFGHGCNGRLIRC